jgi:hypothetical protein
MHPEAISKTASRALGLISGKNLDKGFYLVGGTAIKKLFLNHAD